MTNLITPELKYFPYKDGSLAYREEGAGPVLFFLHGMNGNSRSWASSFLSLRNNFRVIAWDAPSFGSSDSFGDSIEVYQSAAKALIKGLGVEDAILIGHSMGGLVATKLATDPDTSIAGLVLSSSHLGFGHPTGEPLMFRYSNRIEALNKNSADAEYTMERAKRSTPDGTHEDVIKFLADVAGNTRIEGIRDGGRMSQETDNTLTCQGISAPVLILTGAKDSIISTEMHAALVAALPKAEKVVIPEAGHASYAEYPNIFNTYVKEFAKKAWGSDWVASTANKQKINWEKKI
jgi:pimeloyl-ACP methyl ester carboxylesterase